MERHIAAHIVATLAQGIDPHTGLVFPPDSAYQHPDTIRALFEAAQALAAIPPRRAAQGARQNAGKPWSDAEDQALAASFDAGEPLAVLAKAHCRSRAAIQARLVRLGKVEPTPDMPRYRNLLPAAQAA